MSSLGIKLYTLLQGSLVGSDEFGNRYYRNRGGAGRFVGNKGHERRWVVYKGAAEPSTIPPYWHGWLHYSTNEIPTEQDKIPAYKWEKKHQPNLTGTNNAYLPDGHPLKGGRRAKATGDYKAWNPNE
ncbi:MAG: NADH:ubiquinone oxidoreductase subunit NDUFA12 [Proteobacteria bacterium]|nr:NADH:ubiquinone oxidoreductase subunit NDUFA12 [Pseudomonadota bacterium]